MRNVDSHFSSNPVNIDIGRSRFPRPFNHKFTMDVGDLVPFYWSEVLPGDTVQMDTSKVVRLSTLLDPVMDNLFLDTYYFFVPMRLTWQHTKEFFGENTSGPWYPTTEYTVPQMSVSTATQDLTCSVLDYMGVPVQNLIGTQLSVSALPVRAYNVVYRDWFMSEPLETPPNIYLGDATVAADSAFPTAGGHVYVANKLHDYFTSCLPGPQRAQYTVAVPGTGTLVGHLDVIGSNTMHSAGSGLAFGSAAGTSNANYMQFQSANPGTSSFFGNLSIQSTGSQPGTQTKVTYTNLIASRPSDQINNYFTTSINVNELRMAFQMQKWYEKSAMYGGRYIELLKAQFGVTSPDARLQRSEYLGGNRVPISIHQVENNSTAGDVPLGHLGAYSATSDVSNDFIHSFTEHGFLIGVCCVRYKHTYAQGLERAWSRRTMWDFYWPVLANIGNQPVLRKEIFAQGAGIDDNDVFGFQEAWADYRYQPDRVSAYMRPGIDGSLASWHFADLYQTRPSLSEEWIGEDASNVDRTLAVKKSQAPQLICDYLCDSVWTRAMPLYSIPGLVDHH